MLFKLAWRNIWRNKRRSLIVIGSVVVGVIAIIFMDALSTGFVNQMLNNQISTNISYIQIHKNGFRDNKVVQNYIPNPDKVIKTIKEEPQITHYSERVLSFGLLSSASNSSGIYMYGINPEQEQHVSIIKKSIIKGDFLSHKKREIIIGQKLADKLSVSIGDKVVGMSNTLSGNIGSQVFRVSGIFSTPSSEFDGAYIYTNIETLQNMLGIGNKVYEFAMVTEDIKQAPQIAEKLRTDLGKKYEVLSYKEILPLLILQVNFTKETMVVVNLIIGLALIFGIINTMLMAVFERIHEIGVLMSIGMKNNKIFAMILLEAFIIGIVGTVIGILGGFLLNLPLTHSGIDMTLFAEGLKSLGTGAVIYPDLNLSGLINTLITIPFVTVLGAIYPAYKAIKLEPVYAIRYV